MLPAKKTLIIAASSGLVLMLPILFELHSGNRRLECFEELRRDSAPFEAYEAVLGPARASIIIDESRCNEFRLNLFKTGTVCPAGGNGAWLMHMDPVLNSENLARIGVALYASFFERLAGAKPLFVHCTPTNPHDR